MKTLILGATGHVGSRLHTHLQQSGITSIAASRGRTHSNFSTNIIVDSMNLAELTKHLKDVDAVVNCVAGDRNSISKGAYILTKAALNSGKPKIIHLSTMSVYGASEGLITEDSPFDPNNSWYSKAKCEAEYHMMDYAQAGGKVVVLRPGCIHGPASYQWVTRIANLLQNHRLGDLGSEGDGWSNLIHVDDVVKAIHQSLQLELLAGDIQHFNLTAPDSPRWNQYFIDLAISINSTPVNRIHPKQIFFDSKIASPTIKIAEKIFNKLGLQRYSAFLPEPLPNSLVKLFKQQIFIDSSKISRKFDMNFISYPESIRESSAWFMSKFNQIKK